MPRIHLENLKIAETVLKKEKVFTLARLVSILRCSSRAAQTKLHQWQAYTSYNQNSKYYTMPDVPNFNIDGLWHYEGKSFSKHGNLKKTVVYLIRNSESGLSGDQIAKIIGIPARSFLHHFRDASGIRREKIKGVYIYFSAEPDELQRQVQNCRSATCTTKPLADADAIMILVALIKHHHLTSEDIFKLPEVKDREFSAEIIQNFLDHHSLLKKTLDTTH